MDRVCDDQRPESIDERWLLSTGRKIARAMCSQAGVWGDVDLMAADAAYAGWKYLPRWDPTGGQSLQTYLHERMRYAIVDGRRARAHYSREAYEQVKQAREQGKTDPLPVWTRPARSINELQAADTETSRLHGAVDSFDLADPAAQRSFDLVEDRDLAEWLLEKLPARERLVIERMVLDDETPTIPTIEALGRELGLTETRIYAIRRKALNRMWNAAVESGIVAA